MLRRLLPAGTRRGDAAREVVRWWHQRRRARYGRLDRRLARWAAKHPVVSFVQIGSHDGDLNDPLAALIDTHPEWRGVFVEPIPHLFAALTARRGGDDRYRLVNAAITDHDGEVSMTTVRAFDGMPAFASAISTVDPAVLQRSVAVDQRIGDHLETVTVPALTFAALVEGMERIDLLHIDTEGHDAAILRQVDLRRWRPSAILFEHFHLSRRDRWMATLRIVVHGYWPTHSNSDTLAIGVRVPLNGLSWLRSRLLYTSTPSEWDVRFLNDDWPIRVRKFERVPRFRIHRAWRDRTRG